MFSLGYTVHGIIDPFTTDIGIPTEVEIYRPSEPTGANNQGTRTYPKINLSVHDIILDGIRIAQREPTDLGNTPTISWKIIIISGKKRTVLIAH